MHSYKATNGTAFNYNSDFSGDVDIVVAGGKGIIKIPGEDILEFVGYRYVMAKSIDAIKDKNWMELLGNWDGKS